jgi:hypothetical protein
MQVTAAPSRSRSSHHGVANPYIKLGGVSQATAPSVRLDGAISLFDHYNNVPTTVVLWTPFLHRRPKPLFRSRLFRCANTGCPMDSCACAFSPHGAWPLLTTVSQLGAISLLFRQTNIIWIIYIFAFHQISCLRWLRADGLQQSVDRKHSSKPYDPPALNASLCMWTLEAFLLNLTSIQGISHGPFLVSYN